MLTDKMEDLIRIQVEVVKNVKIDKVTVWDSGEGKDGKNATAGYISGLMKSIPPLNEMFQMAGMDLPPFLGSEHREDAPAEEAVSAEA
jgi:flotillin